MAILRVLWLAVFLGGTAYAIDPNRAMSQYIRERWGAEQGFPRGPVYAIGQSNDGYLWIGTQAGLVRFDGLNFRLVRDVPELLHGESVLGLMPDREGSLWIQLDGATLLRYRNGVFDRPVADASLGSRITAMSLANQGELLISLMERGTMIYRQGRFEMIADAKDLPRSPVLSVAQTPDGSIWDGTRGAGLFRFRQGQTSAVTDGLPDLKVNCLASGAAGDLWVGTDEGIVRWNGNHLTAAGMESLARIQILAMARDRDGNIWAGTDSRGLLRLNDRGVSPLDAVDDRSREAVTALFEDREGNLWIGHASGIERLRDSAFVTYSVPEGLPSDGGNPVFVDAENRMWFPPVNGGLWWMKEGQHGHVATDGLDRDVVYSIAGDQGDLWLGRQRGGLTRLRMGQGAFSAQTYTKADGLAQDSVFSVYRARDGSVWAGTLSGGVSHLSGGRFTTYTTASGLLSNTVASILESSNGTMWFATPGGLNALSKGRWRAYTGKDFLPSENVYCLLEDSTGVLWIGTAAGLAFLGPKGIQVPGTASSGLQASMLPEPRLPEPRLRESILGIEEDRYGSLWLATSNHVLRVNRERLLRGTLGEGDLREFGLADGLRGVEGVRRHRSVISDPSGRIWFSLNRGISVVDPARLTRNAAPAIVHVQTISADGSTVRLPGPVHIPGGRQRITFGYTGLSLSIPERVRFRYWLDGFDSAWSEPAATREAVYTNLPPGPYRFRVMATNPDGVWNSNEGTIAFEVDPLFWQTWWFRAGVVLACGGVILAFYRLRMHQLTSRLSLRFEERLTERTRIAQELHDTLLQGFLSASMQVHVAADSLPADSPARPTLTRALQLMRQVTEEGRNAVRGLRSSSSGSLDLEQALWRVQQELVANGTAQEAIGFRIIVDGQQAPLHPLLRDDVYRIGREALINAFRHARAKNIEVELVYSPSQLRILVRDDGCGIDPRILKSGRDGHWGLSGMREKAEQIGARLHVYSGAAAGTEVELCVPGHIAFQGHSRPMLSWFGRRNPLRAHARQSAAAKGNGK
ncbi:MAG TPA: two-component regulator propeller domain-containing protein [Candidatus Acidoferrales bacterium]|jgi:ligand-binding sensor domain-containing protein/signal transduction histidine kinase|nr:two-component regulator propeller domain-containing protein [Candidatus Acidoferrales bacterium]